MTVVVIVGILAGAVVTHARPNVAEGLRGAARIVAADIQRVRELAVAGSSTYHIAFDMDQEFYRLMHTGADPGLDTLPRSPFGDPTDSPTQWTQRLGDLPLCGPSVGLFVVLRGTPVPQTVFDVEFGPLGETTQSSPTVIWLASGSGNARRYISVTVNPVTGNCSIGDVQATPP